MPEENLFYGYCYEAKYNCAWDDEKDRLTFVDEATYISKLSEVNMIAATGLDDMTLTMEVTESSENQLIGCMCSCGIIINHFLLRVVSA